MKNELKKLPKHIGFIIDGNGRWAKSRGLSRSLGHKAGFSTLEKIIKECFFTYNIPYVSIYAFSTENWNRPKEEVDYLMELFRKCFTDNFLDKYKDVKLNIMGDYSRFDADLIKNIEEVLEKTKNNTKYTINIGLNYSGKSELVRAVNNIINEKRTHVDESIIDKHLYTSGQPPLDFCVRTSGELRISGFMLWQIAYAELYFPKKYWPAFNKKDLHKALLEYQSRDRRFGAIK